MTAEYPSYFKPHVRWLPLLTPVTYLSKLLGTRAVAACMQLELFRVWFADRLSAQRGVSAKGVSTA
ncbi:hypothetical protein BZY99_10105 [Pectobacterium versatile]|nr:hypothetical protein BZY99_10105 [Pectobacterium versatile]